MLESLETYNQARTLVSRFGTVEAGQTVVRRPVLVDSDGPRDFRFIDTGSRVSGAGANIRLVYRRVTDFGSYTVCEEFARGQGEKQVVVRDTYAFNGMPTERVQRSFLDEGTGTFARDGNTKNRLLVLPRRPVPGIELNTKFAALAAVAGLIALPCWLGAAMPVAPAIALGVIGLPTALFGRFAMGATWPQATLAAGAAAILPCVSSSIGAAAGVLGGPLVGHIAAVGVTALAVVVGAKLLRAIRTDDAYTPLRSGASKPDEAYANAVNRAEAEAVRRRDVAKVIFKHQPAAAGLAPDAQQLDQRLHADALKRQLLGATPSEATIAAFRALSDPARDEAPGTVERASDVVRINGVAVPVRV